MTSLRPVPLLAGKCAVVIGGTSGIGFAIAQAFVDAAATVGVVGRDVRRCEEACDRLGGAGSGIRAVPCQADVREPDQLQAAFDRTAGELGRITTLVYAAGIGVVQDVALTTDRQWREIMDVNVTGAWRAAQLVFPYLRSAGGGAVIMIGSDAGVQLERRLGAYSVSKAALIALTKELALEGGVDKIRVNCLCPGYIRPGMRSFPDLLPGRPFAEPVPPIGRVGTASDVAAAGVFLASDAAAFITGAVLSIDGGHTAGLNN